MPRVHSVPSPQPVPRRAATQRPTQSSHRFPPPEDFGEALYRALHEAPWVLASLAFHGLLFLVFFLMPAAPRAEVADSASLTMDTQPPMELAPEPETPPDVEPEKEEIQREHEDEVPFDAPPSPEEENPGHGEDDDVPAGDPQFQSLHDLAGISDNPVIGVGPGAAGLWGQRGPGQGRGKRGGGAPKRHLDATEKAIDWLTRHQSANGSWDCDGFSAQCRDSRCSGPGEPVHDPGVTGLALLCYLGQGDTHQSGENKEVVGRALRWLRSVQDAEGCFGPRASTAYQYDHAIASLAMIEAYGMTQSALLRPSAESALGFIQTSRNPYLAWRYGVRDGDNDTSVTGWMVMALKSAKAAQMDVEDSAFRGALDWVDRMTDPEFGKVGYQQRGGQSARTTLAEKRFPATESESMTAVGVLTRIFCGEDPAKSEPVRRGLDLMSKKLPRWDPDAGTIDMYYWYYGTLAAFQAGGDAWTKWSRAMEPAIVDHQRTEKDLCTHGSWDPEDPWSPEGGRVYSTALMTLCLEVYYRYPRVFVGGEAR